MNCCLVGTVCNGVSACGNGRFAAMTEVRLWVALCHAVPAPKLPDYIPVSPMTPICPRRSPSPAPLAESSGSGAGCPPRTDRSRSIARHGDEGEPGAIIVVARDATSTVAVVRRERSSATTGFHSMHTRNRRRSQSQPCARPCEWRDLALPARFLCVPLIPPAAL
jgi:hypothetical protein